ncbi:MAG: tetratricopeptide repeat protein [bacterium]|nr:tetratricopeptide repeat protein [bacterium]
MLRSDRQKGRRSSGANRTRQDPVGSPRESSRAARDIGLFLRSAREAQNLSQDQLAALTRNRPGSVSRAMISAVERGLHLPGLDVLLTLSRTLHVSPGEVLERLELSRGETVETGDLTLDELEVLASRSFWSGRHRRAVAYYDVILHRLANDPPANATERRRKTASIEIPRAAALRRCGAINAARAGAERAIGLTDGLPLFQAQAYVILAALQVQSGCLPLARDAAERAVVVATEAGDAKTQGWAWIEKGEVLHASGLAAEARRAFLQARAFVRRAGDREHEVNVEGNLGSCLRDMGRLDQARQRYLRALELARRYNLPSAEALWLVELGRVSLEQGDAERAAACGAAALAIAKPGNHLVTEFRAEWLLHRIRLHADPGDPDRHRVAYLRKLYARLDEHRGVEEIREFRDAYCAPGGERSP